MLASMRNLAKSLVAKVLLGILVLAFGVWGIQGVASSAFENALSLWGWGPKDLAQVGSITIKGDEYTKSLQTTIRSMSAQSGQPMTLDDAHKFGVDKQVLDNMVAEAAVATTAQKLKLAVSQQVLLNDLANEKAFQDASGKFSSTAFHRALENNNISEAQYFAMRARYRINSAVMNTASSQIEMPKTLDQALVQYTGETRDVQYFDVSATEADVAQPTDSDLDAQYKKTPQAYTAPEYRTAGIMSADAATLAEKQTITPEELQAGYDREKQNFFTPETRTIVQVSFPSVDAAKAAKDRVNQGEDLIKIAGEMGMKEDDVTLADKQQSDFLDAKIGAAAFALKEGDVSDPVQGGLATALLKAAKVNPAKQPSLDEVRGDLTKQLQLEKAKAQLQDTYNAVEDARAQNTKFEDIAQKAGLKFVEIPAISAAGQGQDGKDLSNLMSPDVLKAIFASDVGVENDALGSNDSYTWYEVRSIIPSALKPLDQVKDQVAKDVLNDRVRQAAVDKAKKAVDALKGGETIDAAAQASGQTTKTAQGLKRNQQTSDIDGPALAAAFAVPEQGFTSSINGDGRSARIMQVIKVGFPAIMSASPELDQLKQQVRTSMGSDVQQSLVDALKHDVGVKINEALWKQNTGSDAPVE